jgi:hypothetical protein
MVPAALSQVTTSSVTGFATDSSAATVPGVTITIKEVQTGFTRSATTNDIGEYSILAIPPGVYSFTVEKAGFETIERTGQAITQQLAARVDFVLKVGAVRQTVNVAGVAPLLQTETPSNAVTLSELKITELPTLGHNFLQTAILSPGILPLSSSSIVSVVQGNYFSGGVDLKPVSITASGGRPEFCAFIEDGFDVRDPIYGGYLYQLAPEAITSYRVVRGYDGAQFGGEPSIVYVNSKSGTNDYHGSIWEYHQDAALQARAFGATSTPPLTYNLGGVTFGGPVVIPHVYDGKNKTFVFAEFQMIRDRGSSTGFFTVPTAAEWGGNLSAIPVQLYNPFDIDTATQTRLPFLNNQIPSNLLSPIQQRFKQFVPLPNVANAAYGIYNYVHNPTSITDDTQYLLRVDQALPRNGRMFVKYFRDHVNSQAQGITPLVGYATPLRGQTGSVEWDQPLAQNKLNTLRLAFFRSVTDYGSNPTSQDIMGLLGFHNYNPAPPYWGVPTISVGGLTLPSSLLFTTHRLTTRWGLHENYSWVHGRHTMDFGGLFQPSQWPQKNGTYPRGYQVYDGGYTRQSPTSGGTPIGMADFLLGAFSSARGNPDGYQPFLRTTYYSWYAQDKIQATRKLSLTLGLRWDWWSPPVERYNRWVGFDQNTDQIVFALADPFTWQTDHTTLSNWPGGRGMFENWKKKNYSPRIGLAYLLTPKTTIRAGFGSYYSQGMANFQIFSTFGNGGPPFSNSSSVTNDPGLLTPTMLDTSLFPGPGPIGTINPLAGLSTPDFHAPQSYMEQATFSVERELGANILLSAGYNGNFGRHLMNGGTDLNQATPLDPSNPLPLSARIPFPNYGYIFMQSNRGTSSYNAMYLHFQKHYSNGVDLIASYTWGKSLDQFTSNGAGSAAQNAHCERCDNGYSDFDRRHYFSLGYIWELPFGPKRRFVGQGVGSHILGNWQLSGITQFESGTPASPSMPGSWPNVGPISIARSDRVCNGKLSHPTMQKFFDTSCFPEPAPNTFGNSGRNVIIGPGAQLWDMSLARQFKIRERFQLSARGEFYSVFNHQNWTFPDTSATDGPYFGEIFGKSGPRTIQISLKLKF